MQNIFLLTLLFSTEIGDSGIVGVQGAAFGRMPCGSVLYNESMPRENNLQLDEPYPIPVSQLTDGRGLVVRCKPGQGIMLYGRTIKSFWPVIYRVNALAHKRSGTFTFTLAAFGPNGQVTAEQRNGYEYFVRGWRTKSLVYNLSEGDRIGYTGDTEVTPVIQIVCTDQVYETLLYLDGFETQVMRPGQWWSFDAFRSTKYAPKTLYLEASTSITPTATPASVVPGIPLPIVTPTPTVTPTPSGLSVK